MHTIYFKIGVLNLPKYVRELLPNELKPYINKAFFIVIIGVWFFFIVCLLVTGYLTYQVFK